MSADRLLQARQQSLAGTEPWASYYAAMVSTKYASTTFSSANKGSQTDYPATDAFNSQSVQSRLIDDAFRAYTQAILYVITGNPAFRENGMRILRIWSHMDPTKYAYYPDAHIHSGVPLLRMMAAAELLRYSSVNPSGTGYDLTWQNADTANLTNNLVEPMTATFLYSNKRFMNQHLYSLVGALAGAIFTDNRPRYNERVEWFSVNSTNPDSYANGGLLSLIRRIDRNDPLNPYGDSFVQHQEMGRDQAHAWDGIAKLSEIARLLTIQGTRLDPTKGTVSTDRNAVSPYRFGHNRLLAGAEAFYGYMMGKTIPWIDTSHHSGVLSDAYRGRVFEPIDELYDVYRYDLGVDVDDDAPSVATMDKQADGPTFYWGTDQYNFWNSNPDYNPDYWLSLPLAVAGQARPKQTDAVVQIETRSVALGDQSSVKQEGDRTFVRMHGSKNGTTIAVRTLMYPSRTGYSPVGVLVRTNGPATLQLRKNMTLEPYHTLPVPNTHGQWRYLIYDMDLGLIRGSLAGDNLAYYTVVGSPSTTVDIDSINLQAKSQLTPPTFQAGRQTTLIAVAGTRLSRSLTATDSGGDTLTYDSSGLPNGATLDSSTGTLSWSPTAGDTGTHEFLAVASDGTVDTVLTVTVKVVADRAAALNTALDGYDPKQAYVRETLASLNAAREAAERAAPTADDSAFAACVEQLQAAVAGLRLLSPRLSDGTLDFRGIMTSPTSNAYAIDNLADGDFNTTSGDLRAPSVLDFGAGFRMRADAFGLRARWNFANRSQGANVYGSNDGSTWTLLTSRETTDTTNAGFAMETIPVRDEVKNLSFRFLKVQVDHPGIPTDPAYPGISSFSELRIHGEPSVTPSGPGRHTCRAPLGQDTWSCTASACFSATPADDELSHLGARGATRQRMKPICRRCREGFGHGRQPPPDTDLEGEPMFLRRSLLVALVSAATVLLTSLPASAAASPTVSPAVHTSDYFSYMYDDCKQEGELCSWCPSGYSCAIVNDDNASVNYRKVFWFYRCLTYSVQNWRSWGSFVNNQTGGATTYLYGRSMNFLKSVPADSRLHFYDFEPVWYVKVC